MLSSTTGAYQAQLDDYTLSRKLGGGQYSTVREAVSKSSPATYAIKYLPLTGDLVDQKRLKLLLNEAKVMSEIAHPNIVRLHAYSPKSVLRRPERQDKPVMYLVLDLVTGGELFDYVALGGPLEERLARYYFRQLVAALEFLHGKGFAHRDIKAENLLLDGAFDLKLADFGFSAPLSDNDGSWRLHTCKGTRGYMAPEMHANNPSYSGVKVDLFAAGVLLFIMVAQHPPFKAAIPSQVHLYKLFYNNATFWKAVEANKPPRTFSPELKNLLNKLMALDPSVRPTVTQIKQHPWFKGPIPTQEEIAQEFIARRDKETKSEEGKVPPPATVLGATVRCVDTRSSGPDLREKLLLPEFVPYQVYKPTTVVCQEEPETITERLQRYFEEQKADVAEGNGKMKVGIADREVAIKVRISKTWEGKCCVEVARTEGDKMEFLEVFKEIRACLVAKVAL